MSSGYERVVYHTGHETSLEICSRISAASGYRLLHVKDYEIGTAPISYGLFRGTEVAFRHAMWASVPFYYVDHGYKGRGHFEGYYRINKNWTFFRNLCADNSDAYKKFWQELPPMEAGPNKTVILCKPNLEGSLFLPIIKMWPEEWVNGLVNLYQKMKYSVIVSSKHEGNRLTDWLKVTRPSLIVGHDSNVIVTAAELGIPATNVGYSNEYCIYNESTRKWMLNGMAKQQFRLREMTHEVFEGL